MERERLSAIFELVLAGALWGFGFVAAKWSLETMTPLAITGWRFFLALFVGVIIVAVIPGLRRDLSAARLLLAAPPGLFIGLSLVTQTYGLKYTTATKSGFITILYVLIVPALERFWLRRPVPRFHGYYVAFSLIGVALICDLPSAVFGNSRVSEFERLNIGDALTLLCAFFAALQILWYGRIQDRIGSSFNFNLYQSFWAGIIPLSISLASEPLPSLPQGLPLAGLLMLSLGSTLVAFALQVRAQKTISPSLASLLFLLESPFAGLFAIYFLGERMTTMAAIGALLILASLAASVVFERERATT